MRGWAGALVHPAVAYALLAGFVFYLYWDSLWGVPRTDQLAYLYEAAQFDRFVDLLLVSPSWNRGVSVGDHALFRPLLYIFLALEHELFGRRYMLWQGMGVILHAVQTWLVYYLLRLGAPGAPLSCILGAALFGSLTLLAEMVSWHHINGYLVFSVAVTGSLACLLRHLEQGGRRPAEWSVLFAILATFTYEMGGLYCAMASAVLALGRPDAKGRSSHRLAATFAMIPLLYLVVDVVDFASRFGAIDRSDAILLSGIRLGDGIRFTAYQVYFWAGGVALPSLYALFPLSRIYFRWFEWSPLAPYNIAALVCAAGGMLTLLVARREGIVRSALWGPALAAIYLTAYSAVIAFGRSVPRGLQYTIRMNTHYAYPAALTLFVGVALAIWINRRNAPPVGSGGLTTRWLVAGACGFLALGVVGLVAINTILIRSLLADHRHDYSAPRLELLHHAQRWHARYRNTLFAVSEACPGNSLLPWFALYGRHDTDAYRFLDTLHPATSATLHWEAAAFMGAPVATLACDGRPATPAAILGRWRPRRGEARIFSTAAGHLVAVNERAHASALSIEGRSLLAEGWRLSGLLSHDDRYIFWLNGTTWRR